MHKFYTEIGEHLFEIQADSASFMNTFTKHFHCAKSVSNQTVSMVVYLHGGYVTSTIKDNFSIKHDMSKHIFRQNNFRIDITENYQSAHLYIYSGQALTTAFITLYSLYITNSGWGIMLHGEYRINNGKAQILSGFIENKTNIYSKNTTFMIPTSIVLIKISSDGATLCTTTQDLKQMRPLHGLPVSGIQLLQQSVQNKQMNMDRTNALIRLIDFVLYWPGDTEQMRSMITLLKKLVNITPVYQTYVNNDERVSELIS